MPGRPRPGEYLENAWIEDETWAEPDLEQSDPVPEPFPRPTPEPDPIPRPVPEPPVPAPDPAPVPDPVPVPVPSPPVPPTPPAPPLPDPQPLPLPDPGSSAVDLPSAVASMELKPALEAILMVVVEPTTTAHLAEVLERPKRVVERALRELAAEYTEQGRGFELRFVAGGWRYYSRASCSPAVDRFVLDGQHARLTQAALETLAVIAYRQPVSRSRVSAVRGVNCDGVMRTLVQRGLVEETGSEPETGAFLYRTTQTFLERMGLRGLDELPELAPFLPEADDVEADSQEGSAIAEAVATSR
jgi:segregation and condensation protein B